MDFGVDRHLQGNSFGVYRKGDPLKIRKYNFKIIMSTMILKSLNINLHYKFNKITQYVEIV